MFTAVNNLRRLGYDVVLPGTYSSTRRHILESRNLIGSNISYQISEKKLGYSCYSDIHTRFLQYLEGQKKIEKH
jgi:hypothetical protein